MKKNLIRAAGLVLAASVATPAFAGGMTVANDGDKKLKLEGLVFADMTKKDTTTAGLKQPGTAGTNVTRAYVTAKYYLNKDWMFRITTDFAPEAGLRKKNNVYIKYAYMEGKLAGDAAVMRLGVSHEPWIDYEQHLWKHRYFTKVTSDEFKYDNSADAGVGLKGKLADGMVNYWITQSNGGGYGNTASTGKTDTNARIGLNVLEGLTIDAQYRRGFRGAYTAGAGKQSGSLTQFMVSYGTSDFRVGGNYLINDDKNLGKASAANAKANTYALWGHGSIANGFGLVGRYEVETSKPSTGLTAAQVKQKRTRTVIGVDYSPVKGIDFTLGYVNDKTKNSGYAAAAGVNKTTTYGLWSQIKM